MECGYNIDFQIIIVLIPHLRIVILFDIHYINTKKTKKTI